MSGSPVGVALATSLDPAPYGLPVTLIAQVTADSAQPATPTGKVKFKEGSTLLGKATLKATGVAKLAISSLPAGVDSIRAVYTGDANFAAGSSTAFSETIDAGTTTSVESSASQAAFGQSITFTATVTSDDGTPGGKVRFKDGSTLLGKVKLNSSGVAEYTTNGLAVGTDSISAVYAGATGYSASNSSAWSQTVASDATTTVITSPTISAAPGQSVTLTAMVSATGGTPTGQVTFENGLTVLGSTSVDATGTASLTLSNLPAGTDWVTAVYSGDSMFSSSSSNPQSEVIASGGSAAPAVLAATTTLLTPSTDSATYGQAITWTANVASGSGIPTGSVSFQEGSTILGTSMLNASGDASLVLSNLPVGMASITAVYAGSGNFLGSSSETINEQINAPVPTVSLAASASVANYGQSLTFTADVTSSLAHPTGSVTFENGSTSIGTAALNSGGTATLTLSNLPPGTDIMTAVYGGDTLFAATSSGAADVQIDAAATTTSLSSSSNPSANGQSLTFTATVTSLGGTLTGSVVFDQGPAILGTSPLNQSGQATLMVSNLTAGTYSVIAVYTGNTNFATSQSNAISQVVSGGQAGSGDLPSFTYSVPSSDPTLPSGMNDFAPPIATEALPAGVPTIGAADTTAEPNDNISITGSQFTSLTGANAFTDTQFQVFGQTDSSNATLTSSSIEEASAD
ncbi:MAG TPA: Ig-like domain-containing protein, partial [Tepidisphaeraceae bacterium]|nr:Ig-like domain-containing protein [Tepidisphaeraceae bacterium]